MKKLLFILIGLLFCVNTVFAEDMSIQAQNSFTAQQENAAGTAPL